MSDDPLIGRQLANFLIEKRIGRGGMAQVYYGQDIKLERPVAIKVIDARHRESPTYAERFIREARTVATWRHEHIIHIYYADDADDLYYFVMEYIDGLDLGQLLGQYAENGRMIPQAEAWRLGNAVATALDYAHEQGVIHRDVKPSNVMVAEDGRVVLTDFGLAMDVAQGSLGEVFGSSHYIAPEQAHRSADAVPQSDLYSLGIMLYEMLAGQVPFDDPSPTAVALQHVTLDPPPPRQVNPELSQDIEAVILKALSKSPEDRYQTGQALLEALAEAMDLDQAEIAGKTEPSTPAETETIAVVAEDIGKVSTAPRKVVESNSDGAGQDVAGVETSAKVADKDADEREDEVRLVKTDTLLSNEKVEPTTASPPGGVTTMPIAPEQEAKVSAAAQPEDELLGSQLDEYQLEDLLGRGGMARVYRGLDVRLNRAVAIKVIDTPFRADEDYLVRFEREAQAIAQLDHPNIITVYRFGEANGLLYLAMRYIEGDDLDVRLANYRDDEVGIPPEEAARIIREVCAALDCAHENGVIHRDVKPSNILLNQDDRVILTDFGLALLTEEGTQGEIFGSPHYIAPEQAVSSAGVVPQSDLYAIGVILYEMFTGQLPFRGEKPLDIAMLHIREAPQPPREIRPELSPELEAVIIQALAKKPEERYPTGAALADALDEALQLTVDKEEPATEAEANVGEPIEDELEADKAKPDKSDVDWVEPEPSPAVVVTSNPVLASPMETTASSVVDRSLPPIPAAVATAPPPDTPPATAPIPAAPVTSPAPEGPPGSRVPMNYLIIIGVMIVILLAIIAYLLWQSTLV